MPGLPDRRLPRPSAVVCGLLAALLLGTAGSAEFPEERSSEQEPSPWHLPRPFSVELGDSAACNPTMSADGRRAVWQGDAGSSIWEALWDEGKETWTDVRSLPHRIFAGFRFPWLSAEGHRLYLVGEGQIQYCNRTSWGPWGLPRPLLGEINSGGEPGAASVTAKGREVYFATTRPGGMGGSDLWVCRLRGSVTDSLTHLGSRINTARWEGRPRISPDGQQLLFRDFGREAPTTNQGSLYLAERTRGKWQRVEHVPLGGRAAEKLPEENLPEEQGSIRIGHMVATRSPSFREGARNAPRGGLTRPVSGPDLIALGGQWRRLVRFGGVSNVYDLLKTRAGVLLAVTDEGDVLRRSTNEGRSWFRVSLDPAVRWICTLHESPDGTLWVGAYPDGRVLRSEDQGASWTSLAALPPWVSAVRAIEDLGKEGLVVGVIPEAVGVEPGSTCGRVFRSLDGGESWRIAGEGLPAIEKGVVDLLFVPESSTLWAGGRTQGVLVHRSIDSARTWSSIPSDCGNHKPVRGEVSRFYIDSHNQLWAIGWADRIGGLLLEYNEATWVHNAPFARRGTTSGWISDFAESTSGQFFVATEPGTGSVVWISTDRGQSWSPAPMGEEVAEARRLVALPGGRMLCGTGGEGSIWVWEPQ